MKKKSIYVLGDSISMHYGPFLKSLLEDKGFIYDRKRDGGQSSDNLDIPVGANGGDSGMALEFVKENLSYFYGYDLMLINCGLHDIKTDPITGEKQIVPEKYAKNLDAIFHLFETKSTKLIWVRTTPVNAEQHNKIKNFHRCNEDVILYNQIADEIVSKYKVPVIDLYTFTYSLRDNPHYDGVHFIEEVRSQQAQFIANNLF